jgi:hypothetical protein
MVERVTRPQPGDRALRDGFFEGWANLGVMMMMMKKKKSWMRRGQQRTGRGAHAHRPVFITPEFAPAIPWWVAPQQSPPPLHRMGDNVGSHEPDTIALIEYLLTCRGGAFGCRGPGPRNDGPAEPGRGSYCP